MAQYHTVAEGRQSPRSPLQSPVALTYVVEEPEVALPTSVGMRVNRVQTPLGVPVKQSNPQFTPLLWAGTPHIFLSI